MSPPRLAYVGPAHEAPMWLFTALGRVGRFEALCDEHAGGDASRINARWTFDDLATMLREAEPDGVVVATALAVRGRVIKECLAAGAGVIVTGLPAPARDCPRIATLAKLSGRPVLAAPASRFSPAILMARRLAESGKVGRPISMMIRSTRRGSVRDGEDPDAPAPVDQVYEAVDLVHHLVGPLVRTAAMGHPEGALAVAAMTVDGVPVSMVCHSTGPVEVVGLELETRGSDGSCLRVDRDGRLHCGQGARVDAFHGPSLATVDPVVELGYEGLIAEFARCLQADSGRGIIGRVGEIAKVTESILRTTGRRCQARRTTPSARPVAS